MTKQITPKVCPKGHPMTQENTYFHASSNYAECRECRNERKRRYRQSPKGKETLKRNLIAWADRQRGGVK